MAKVHNTVSQAQTVSNTALSLEDIGFSAAPGCRRTYVDGNG